MLFFSNFELDIVIEFFVHEIFVSGIVLFFASESITYPTLYFCSYRNLRIYATVYLLYFVYFRGQWGNLSCGIQQYRNISNRVLLNCNNVEYL